MAALRGDRQDTARRRWHCCSWGSVSQGLAPWGSTQRARQAGGAAGGFGGTSKELGALGSLPALPGVTAWPWASDKSDTGCGHSDPHGQQAELSLRSPRLAQGCATLPEL